MVEEEDLVSLDPPKKNSKQKALDLSLRYNFVTPLTSLVVTKPKKIDSEDGEEDEDPVLIVDPVPVRSGFGGFGGYQPFSAGGGIRLASAAGNFPRGGTFGVRSSGSFMVHKMAGPPGPPGGPFTRAGGPPGAYGRPSYV